MRQINPQKMGHLIPQFTIAFHHCPIFLGIAFNFSGVLIFDGFGVAFDFGAVFLCVAFYLNFFSLNSGHEDHDGAEG
jgi:hypothetical protein